MESMQYHLDTMEDPNCSTEDVPPDCTQCRNKVFLNSWFVEEHDFCCQHCMKGWIEENIEE